MPSPTSSLTSPLAAAPTGHPKIKKRKNHAMARTKILSGAELASYVKARQRQAATTLTQQNGRPPRLMILRDSSSPVIERYVLLKQRYGLDIGVQVDDCLVDTPDLAAIITRANANDTIDGVVVQLPLDAPEYTEEVVNMILPEKDVDALGPGDFYDGATATAIHWLLAGYDIELQGEHIAIVGYGRLVGRPLAKLWQQTGLNVTVFDLPERIDAIRADGIDGVDTDLSRLVDYGVVVTATGVPGLIKNEMISSSTVVVDAGVASEHGVLRGDIEDAIRERKDLAAITPKVGGVGPLTIAALFENVLRRID